MDKKRKLDSKEKTVLKKKFKVDKSLSDNYKEIDLEEYKKKVLDEQSYCYNRISILKDHIKDINRLISKKCIEKNGEHEWISEREEGLYGERYTFCKHCRVDIYDNTYLHY